MKAVCKDAFKLEDGQFIKALEAVLDCINVHREAYYGGTFTGNHANKCLKVFTLFIIIALHLVVWL